MARSLDTHEKTRCVLSKRGLTDLLGQTKTLWEARKRRRIGDSITHLEEQTLTVHSSVSPDPAYESDSDRSATSLNSAGEQIVVEDAPLALRRPRRERKLPARYAENAMVLDSDDEGDHRPEPLIPLDVNSGTVNRQPASECSSTLSTAATCIWNWEGGGLQRQTDSRYGVATTAYNFPRMTPRENRSRKIRTNPQNLRQLRLWSPEYQHSVLSKTSAFWFADWWWNGGNEKSTHELQKFLTLVTTEGFSFEDAFTTDWKATIKAFDADEKEDSTKLEDEESWFDDANWIHTPITIPVPFHRFMKNSGTKAETVGQLKHRRIISVIEEKIRNVEHGRFHYQPYELRWSPPSDLGVEGELDLRVQGELYNSPAFVEAHQKLQNSPPIPGCSRERVVVALMFWSDETHLSSFGSAKLWLCISSLGTSPNTEDQKHRSGSANISLILKLSDDFKDKLRSRNGGKAVPPDLIRQCAREIFHAQWDIILGDQELIQAMEHGTVLLCRDGVERRFFPTCFTYSADYPEKARVAAIKQNGRFPCPNCLTPKSELQNMGTSEDIDFRTSNLRLDNEENRAMITRALKEVKDGYAITGKSVDKHLESRSLLPVKNTFSSNLAPFGYDIFQSLVVDPLHEFEIGVWKGLYIHLLRLLRAFGKSD
ncbi:hypothetical protein BKA70DRAFT_1440533, partial [Coprinopsis sp. MPI-PUGE-AT-0042]